MRRRPVVLSEDHPRRPRLAHQAVLQSRITRRSTGPGLLGEYDYRRSARQESSFEVFKAMTVRWSSDRTPLITRTCCVSFPLNV